MKKKIKDITIGIIIVCILMTTTPVLADDIVQQINVIFNNIQVQVNGNNVDVDSILYNGVTYLPMRRVTELVGKELEWNGDTKTANIVDKKQDAPKDIIDGTKKEELPKKDEDLKKEVGDGVDNEITYTEEEYQAFKNMFTLIDYEKIENNTKHKVLKYNGELTKEELKSFLNIKNCSNRNIYLKRMVDEYSDIYSNGLNFVLVYDYRNNGNNSTLGGILKSLNGDYEIEFYSCDI